MTKKPQNILVLENVSDLDFEMGRYLRLEHDNDNVEVLVNLSRVSKEKLHKELLKADCLCVQSLFTNRDQLKEFVFMLGAYPNIKDIRIIHGYTSAANPNRLLQLLNFDTEGYYKQIVELVKTRKVSEIFCRTVEDTGKEKSKFFKNLELQYDIVPLYVNYDEFPTLGLIWHEKQPCPDKNSLKYYKKVKNKKEKSVEPKEGLHIVIEPNDITTFKALMRELKAVVEYQKESCELQDFGESDVLIPEKEAWLALMAKYKLTKGE